MRRRAVHSHYSGVWEREKRNDNKGGELVQCIQTCGTITAGQDLGDIMPCAGFRFIHKKKQDDEDRNLFAELSGLGRRGRAECLSWTRSF